MREARLRRAESLASLTTLAAGVAHEIKNPLGSIGIHTQLIQKIVDSLDEETAASIGNYLTVIDEEIDRLNKIVVDFLFAVRPMNTNLEDGDLNAVALDVLGFVQFELEQSGIELVKDLDPELPGIRLDAKYIKQAMMNLIKNAISAMPDGGMLRVSTQRRGDQVLLRISDTGTGMSEEVREKIFEPYFTTKDFGSGIGLTLVYKVVKEHMGEITVISKEGHGTTFTITLPVPQRRKHLLGWRGKDTP
jgi:signal transduction histidine kinase